MTDEHKRSAKRHLGIVFRVGIAILACWWVAKGMNFGKVGEAFSRVSWFVLVEVVVIFILSQIILALRWWLFMRAWDIHIAPMSAIKLTFLGLYFNNFLPGSVGGDVVRAWYVAKHTHKRMPAIVSVIVDRVLALFGTILMAGIMASIAFRLAGSNWLDSIKKMVTQQESSGIISMFSRHKIMILSSILTVFIISSLILLSPFGRRSLKYLYINILQHGKNAVKQALQAGLMLIWKPYLLPESLSLTFILQGMVVVSLWILGRQMGIPTELKMYFVFFLVMWVIGSIPISIAGIGIVEAGLIMLFMNFGAVQFGALPPSVKDAVNALVLSQRAIWLIASLPGLWIYLAGKHLPANFAQQFSVDDKKTIS